MNTITALTANANGNALPMELFRKLPRIFLVSDSMMVANEGHASIKASTSVIWIGINGNGMFPIRQNSETKTEYIVFIKKTY